MIQTFVEDIRDMDENYLQDIACIALNMLLSPYVRHDVDEQDDEANQANTFQQV